MTLYYFEMHKLYQFTRLALFIVLTYKLLYFLAMLPQTSHRLSCFKFSRYVFSQTNKAILKQGQKFEFFTRSSNHTGQTKASWLCLSSVPLAAFWSHRSSVGVFPKSGTYNVSLTKHVYTEARAVMASFFNALLTPWIILSPIKHRLLIEQYHKIKVE